MRFRRVLEKVCDVAKGAWAYTCDVARKSKSTVVATVSASTLLLSKAFADDPPAPADLSGLVTSAGTALKTNILLVAGGLLAAFILAYGVRLVIRYMGKAVKSA